MLLLFSLLLLLLRWWCCNERIEICSVDLEIIYHRQHLSAIIPIGLGVLVSLMMRMANRGHRKKSIKSSNVISFYGWENLEIHKTSKWIKKKIRFSFMMILIIIIIVIISVDGIRWFLFLLIFLFELFFSFLQW